MQQLTFFQIILMSFFLIRSQHEVDATFDDLCSRCVFSIEERIVVETMQQVTANLKLLLEFYLGSLSRPY